MITIHILEYVKKAIEERVKDYIRENYEIDAVPKLEIKNIFHERYGDFSTTIAFELGKILALPAITIANEIVYYLNNGNIPHIEAKAIEPGYINIHLDFTIKLKVLEEIAVAEVCRNNQYQQFIEQERYSQEFEMVLKNMEYLCFRIRWVLDIFEKEGVIPDIKKIEKDHFHSNIEMNIFDQLIFYWSIVGDGYNFSNTEKHKNILENICKLGYQYINDVIFRNLQEPHRNLVLSILLCIGKILAPYIEILNNK